MTDKTKFRNAMAYVGSAVNIITTSGEHGHHGFTASAVCSVTDSPPTLLVCMNSSSALHQYFLNNSFLAVNVLHANQEEISRVFATPEIDRDTRFTYGEWTTLISDTPVLVGSLANFDCKIIQTHDLGTHTIFYAEILQTKILDDHTPKEALLYFGRQYHQLSN